MSTLLYLSVHLCDYFFSINPDTENSEVHLKEQLLLLQQEGTIKAANIDYMTSFISGGLNELALKISRTQAFDTQEIESSIRLMLEGMRQDG